MLAIRYYWANTATAQRLGFGRSGCFAVERAGGPLVEPIAGFATMDEATRFYETTRAYEGQQPEPAKRKIGRWD